MSRFLNSKYQGFEAYTPGEQPKDMEYVKLNTNESPYPPSQEVVDAVNKSEIELLIERFNQEPNQYAVRGKWALSFLVKMLNYIVQERKTYAPSLYSGEMDNPGCLWDMKEEQAVLVLSPRIPICKTLYDFCNVHITEYLASLGEEV